MSLPDLTRAAATPRARLRSFGNRLTAVGLTPAAAAPIVGAARCTHPAVRRPIEVFQARERKDVVGAALRMFVFGDPVTEDEARAVLGDLLEEIVEAGLVARSAEGLASPFVMGLFDDLYVVSDAPGGGVDAVMGLADTTVTLGRAVLPRAPLKRALDLGCGSGALALLLARSSQTVVASDLSPRAIELAKINAAINGSSGVDFRVGDRFATVEGETFDLVVSQPPFVPKPEGLDARVALYGGARGDELALSVFGALPRHLARGGRAVMFVEWPDGPEPLEARLRAALGPAPNLLVMSAPPSDGMADAVEYAAALHPRLGPAFEAEALARLRHLRQAGIAERTPTLVVVERSADPKAPPGGFTSNVPIEPFGAVSVTSERIDRMLAARALARRGPEALLDARLLVPEGTVLSQTQVGPGAEVPSTLAARFPPNVGVRPIDMTMELLFLITIVHEAATVREAIPRCADVMSLGLDEARAKSLEAIGEALEYGLLEIA